MNIDFKNLSSAKRYKLMSNTIAPRPIAWIVTKSDDVINIAPFSYFIPLSSNPPIVVVSIGQKDDGTPKDTLANILQTKKATICLAQKEFIKDITNTASNLSKNISESEEFNIPTRVIKKGYPPIVDGVKLAYFADFYDTFPLGKSPTIPTFLEIIEMYADESIVDEKGHLKPNSVGRVGRSYLYDYTLEEQ